MADYTDIDAVRYYLPDETTYTDEAVQDAIDQMTVWVNGFMEIDDFFGKTAQIDIEEDGAGTSVLLIRNEMRPLVAFTAISVDEVALTGDALANIRYDDVIHALYYINGYGSFPKGFRNITITASWGFDPIPYLAKNAITKAVVRVLVAGGVASFSESGDASSSIEQVRIEDALVRFKTQVSNADTTLTTGDNELDNILFRYKFPYVTASVL